MMWSVIVLMVLICTCYYLNSWVGKTLNCHSEGVGRGGVQFEFLCVVFTMWQNMSSIPVSQREVPIWKELLSTGYAIQKHNWDNWQLLCNWNSVSQIETKTLVCMQKKTTKNNNPEQNTHTHTHYYWPRNLHVCMVLCCLYK